jgi:PST family polysaccharide transporter
MALKSALLWSALQTGTRLVLSFISIKVTAVYLGPAGLAVTAQFSAFLSLLHGAIGNALQTGVIKMTAEVPAQGGQSELLAPLWSTAMKLALLLAVLAGLVVAAVSVPLADWLLKDPAYWPAMVLGGLTLPLVLAGTVLTGAVNGLQHLNLVGLIGTGAAVAGALAFIPLCYFFGVAGGLAGTALAYCSMFFVALLCVRRAPSIHLRDFLAAWDRPVATSLLAFFPMLLVHSIFTPLPSIVIRDMLAADYGLASAGQWQAAARLSDMFTLVLTTALSMYLMPHLSAQEGLRFNRELAAATLKVTALAAAGSAAIYLLRDLVIAVVFTPEFNPVRELLPYILIGDVLKMAAWPLQMALVIKLRSAWYMGNILGMGAIFVGLTWLWLPSMGVKAATAAYAVANGLCLLSLLVAYREYWHELRSETI